MSLGSEFPNNFADPSTLSPFMIYYNWTIENDLGPVLFSLNENAKLMNSIFINNAGGVLIDGAQIQIENCSFIANIEYAIHVKDSAYISTISNSIFIENIGDNIIINNASVNINNNQIRNGNANGIVITRGLLLNITSNEIFDNLNNGIYIHDNDASISIQNDIINGNYQNGIILNGTKNILIEDCQINNNHMNGIVSITSLHLFMINNMINNNGESGTYVYNSNSILLEETYLFQNGKYGLAIIASSIVINNATISNSAVADLFLDGSANLISINSTYNPNSIIFNDVSSLIKVQWFLEISVIDKCNNCVVNAKIEIWDNPNGTQSIITFTNVYGKANWIILTEYVQNIYGRIYYTPFTIRVSNPIKGVSRVDFDIHANKAIIIKITLETTINDIKAQLNNMSIQNGVKNSLQSKIAEALNKIDIGLIYETQGDYQDASKNFKTATNVMSAFQNEVNAQNGKKISVQDSQTLLSLSNNLINLINNYHYGCNG
jgi:hypothetical protein